MGVTPSWSASVYRGFRPARECSGRITRNSYGTRLGTKLGTSGPFFGRINALLRASRCLVEGITNENLLVIILILWFVATDKLRVSFPGRWASSIVASRIAGERFP